MVETGQTRSGSDTASAGMSDLVELGRRLREAREEARLSASAVADAVGISAAYVRVLEGGENRKTGRPSRPSPSILAALCQTLNLDLNDLSKLAGLRVSQEQVAQAERMRAARGAITEALETIQAAAATIADRGPFMVLQMQNRMKQTAVDMGRMSRGTVRCRPEEEPRMAREAARMCESHIRAVSFQDEAWWAGREGVAYLRDQEQERKRGIDITRIFLFKDSVNLGQYREAFQRHLDLGIETYVLRVSAVPTELLSDLVIYDDALVRRGLTEDIEGGGKLAEFSDDVADVNQALFDFENLLEIATDSHAAALASILAEVGEGT